MARKPNVKGFWEEFRSFAFQGNMIDLAVGLIVGTAFKELVTSLVDNVIMPPIGMLLGNAPFENLFINLGDQHYATLAEAQAAAAPVIMYGAFISQLLDFIILALTVFLVLKIVFRYQKPEDKKKKEKK